MQAKNIAGNLESRAGKKYRAAGAMSPPLPHTPIERVGEELKGETQNPKKHIYRIRLENSHFC